MLAPITFPELDWPVHKGPDGAVEDLAELELGVPTEEELPIIVDAVGDAVTVRTVNELELDM